MNIISLMVAGLPIIVSVVALYFSARASKAAKQTQDRGNGLQEQNNSLQERMVSLEEARQNDAIIDANKAILTAKLVRTVKEYKNKNCNLQSTSTKLEIENIGRSTAKNVRAFISGTSIIETDNILTKNGEHSVIGPKSNVSYSIRIMQDFRPPFQFSSTWEDASGVPGKYETTLT